MSDEDLWILMNKRSKEQERFKHHELVKEVAEVIFTQYDEVFESLSDDADDYSIPEEIKKLFSKDFLCEFRDNLIQIFNFAYDAKYKDTYVYRESTVGWCNAFEISCKKFNLDKLYNYYRGLGWEHSDMFDGDLGDILVEEGIIEEGEY